MYFHVKRTLKFNAVWQKSSLESGHRGTSAQKLKGKQAEGEEQVKTTGRRGETRRVGGNWLPFSSNNIFSPEDYQLLSCAAFADRSAVPNSDHKHRRKMNLLIADGPALLCAN